MKKKLFLSMILVVMLVFISFATAVSSTTDEKVKQKESPLFQIRAKQAISEKIIDIIENIKTRFLGERIFFIRFESRLWAIQNFETPLRHRFFKCSDTAMCGPTSETICP